MSAASISARLRDRADLIKRGAMLPSVEAFKAELIEAADTIDERNALFELRWNADMRATKRWQAGDELAHCGSLRPLLGEIVDFLRTVDADGLADRLCVEIEESKPGNRKNTWPDRADLVVWLLGEIDAIRAALEPVMHWYDGEPADGDDHKPRELVDILTDVVSDLQSDRAGALAMHAALQPFAACMEYIRDDESDDEWAKFRLIIKNYRDAAAARDGYGGEKRS